MIVRGVGVVIAGGVVICRVVVVGVAAVYRSQTDSLCWQRAKRQPLCSYKNVQLQKGGWSHGTGEERGGGGKGGGERAGGG